MNQIEALYKKYCQSYLVSTDSRKIVPNSVFFALKGKSFNGNVFAQEAYQSGCNFCVIDDEKFQLNDNFLLVDNVLATMQELAKFHVTQLDIPIICLTGSNGKTTTKELITAILSSKYKVVSTKGNFNNHIGVPITLLSINRKHEIAVVELGANHIGEVEFLCELAQPNLGLITNFGNAHLEGFGSFEKVVEAKTELFDYITKMDGTVLINNEDKLQISAIDYLAKRLTYGVNGNIKVSYLDSNPFVQVKINDCEIQSNLIGEFNFSNISAAIAVGMYFDVSVKGIKKAIEEYIPSNNRSQIIKTKHNTILLDAYNANPSSMEAVLRSFVKIKHKNKIVVLGDMFELGNYSSQLHQKTVNLTKKLHLKNVFFIGSEFQKVTSNAFKKLADFINYINANPMKDAFVLIKGSRGMKLERLVEYL